MYIFEFSRICLLFAIQYVYATTVSCNEFEWDNLQSSKLNDKKIPRLMKEIYTRWSTYPKVKSHMIHSFPVDVKELEDDTMLMTSLYKEKYRPTLTAHLLIEFSDAMTPSELNSRKYYAEITPLVGQHYTTAAKHGCSSTSAISKSRFVDNLLDMKFDIKPLYTGCKKVDKNKITFKFRLLGLDGKLADIDMKVRKYGVFIFLREGFSVRSEDIVPTESLVKSLHHIRNRRENETEVPTRRSQVRSHAKRRRVPKFGNPQAVSMLRHYTKPWMNGKRQYCKVRSLNVDFDDIGWDWVIAPSTFNVYRCSGKCSVPMPSHLNPSSHAILQTIVNSIIGSPRAACCVPNDLGSLTFLFNENNSVAIKSFPDMVVHSCACM